MLQIENLYFGLNVCVSIYYRLFLSSIIWNPLSISLSVSFQRRRRLGLPRRTIIISSFSRSAAHTKQCPALKVYPVFPPIRVSSDHKSSSVFFRNKIFPFSVTSSKVGVPIISFLLG